MATTAGGLPYVESSDLISGYPTVSQALAEELDTQLAAKGDIAGETWTGTHDFTGATVTGITAGLVPMAPTSTASGGGTVSLQGDKVLFSGVTSISLNGVFTSDYLFYRVILSCYASTSTPNGYLRYRASGSDLTGTEYNYSQNYGSGANSASNATSALVASLGSVGLERGNITFDVTYPANGSHATTASGVGFRASSPLMYMHGNTYTASTVIDGFTFYVTTGTTTGHVAVFGYNA